jgi:L-2,4-diaminobutyrate transaminase
MPALRTAINTSPVDTDRRFVFHPFSDPAAHERGGSVALMLSGNGSRLVAEDGTEVIDAMAGLWCVNVGYGRQEIADALRDQALRLPYFHSFSSMATAPPAQLAEKIVGLAGPRMSKVFYGNSGSDANDTQLKLVWMYNNLLGRPEKKKVIARRRGYHGVTIAAASLTGLPAMHQQFDLPLPRIKHTTAPHRLWEAELDESDAAFSRRLADDLEALILAEGPETVAAFIGEPVQAAGGVIIPPDGYWPANQAVLRKYDVLLIADEVVSGFGRLGSWFGSEVLSMEPDLVTVAKGITSAYVPLSGCIISDAVWQVIAGSESGIFQHGYTYSSHPLAAAAALANLELVEREGLIDQAARRGELLRSALRDAFGDHPLVGEVRGKGLVAAVEFVAKRDPATAFDPSLRVGARITAASLKRGIVTRALPAADTISFSPPFVVTEDEIGDIVAGTRAALDEVADELTRERA